MLSIISTIDAIYFKPPLDIIYTCPHETNYLHGRSLNAYDHSLINQ